MYCCSLGCAGSSYNSRTQICCGGAIHLRGFSNACCGTVPYNSVTQICCSGTTIYVRGESTHCCGDLPYNSRTHICCEKHVRYKGFFNACCGSVPYNSITQFCCDGNVQHNSCWLHHELMNFTKHIISKSCISYTDYAIIMIWYNNDQYYKAIANPFTFWLTLAKRGLTSFPIIVWLCVPMIIGYSSMGEKIVLLDQMQSKR